MFPGGRAPVTAYLRASITVVLPQPLAPTIMVRGKQKEMTCSSSSGEKARIPRTESLFMDAIFFLCFLGRWWWGLWGVGGIVLTIYNCYLLEVVRSLCLVFV